MSPAAPKVPEEGTPDLKKLNDDASPSLTILGHMADGSNVAVRLGWQRGMLTISNSRLKFIRDELKMNIVDKPEEYLF